MRQFHNTAEVGFRKTSTQPTILLTLSVLGF
ncbi:hypothetical protein Cri9333_1092 [Crinalium epipsammum PCC 9333]|uniref:Uncharacterized protein n=1 Tax=Crinalium epipsammum PCC 9333 TaxID=1173022 RepID=K9VV67_9CYAN|nr:hypothetical protein Cri9333_1092 [Crinalium epipsammum PCC 9333]